MSAAATREAYRGFALRFACDLEALPPELRTRFVGLSLDDETRAFVDVAVARPHGAVAAAAHGLLGKFLSDFDVNGLLGTYPLFLLSAAQWETMLPPRSATATATARPRRLLDVGAGSGDVTARFASAFDDVTTTETSAAMARRLRRRFRTLEVDLADAPPLDGTFDVVTCLNVLDRCAKPRTLLRKLVDRLSPEGRLVVATPLPFDPFVFRGGATRAPDEDLAVQGATFERAFVSLVETVLRPAGLAVERFACAPYLSGGDQGAPLYVLDDAVLVCRRGP